MPFDLGSLLQQYISAPAAAGPQSQHHFEPATPAAPNDILSAGLAAMFRSDETPAFGQMAGRMFKQANPNQQAGMLNSMFAAMGPAVLAALLNKGEGPAADGALGSLLGPLAGRGVTPRLTPAEAAQLSPEQVAVIAEHAEQADPSVIDRLSNFYAENPTLMKTVGTAALTIALAKMAERTRN